MNTKDIGETTGIRYSIAPREGRWQIVLSSFGVFDSLAEVALYMREQGKELEHNAQVLEEQHCKNGDASIEKGTSVGD